MVPFPLWCVTVSQLVWSFMTSSHASCRSHTSILSVCDDWSSRSCSHVTSYNGYELIHICILGIDWCVNIQYVARINTDCRRFDLNERLTTRTVERANEKPFRYGLIVGIIFSEFKVQEALPPLNIQHGKFMWSRALAEFRASTCNAQHSCWLNDHIMLNDDPPSAAAQHQVR